MTLTQTLENYLAGNNVQFLHRKHTPTQTAHETAVVEHIPDHELAKTVVLHVDKGFCMAILAADRHIDMGEFCSKLGSAEVRLATEDELVALFPDCELGAMPPFGNLYAMPVFLDRRLADDAIVIAFNAGTHQDTLYMSTEEYKRLVNPFIFSFSRGV